MRGNRVADRILILDDEPSILDTLKAFLNGEGHDCLTTTSPAEALKQLKKERFSLLLTDLRMPEISGLDVVSKARKIDSDVAVVVVTVVTEVINAVEAMRAGADDYVLKPFTLTEISLAVQKALEKRRLVLENRHYQVELERRVAEATEELRRANGQLQATRDYLINLLHSSVDAIITTDHLARIDFANEGCLQMFGYKRDDLLGKPAAKLCVGGREEVHYLRRMLGEERPLQNYETELRHREGRLIPVSVSLSLCKNADGRLRSALAIIKDITQQKRLQEELKEISIKDSLTGLYNQRHFHDRLGAEVERARRQRHSLSLLLLDVDQFKTYNDRHGHLEGDNVLNTVGKVVFECTREHVDLGFRYGGDEFTIILPEADQQQAYSIADRIRRSFADKHFDDLTLSVGVITYQDGWSARKFTQLVDAMMYDAKRSGGNRVHSYSANR